MQNRDARRVRVNMSVSQTEIVGQGGHVEWRDHVEIRLKDDGQYKVECRQNKNGSRQIGLTWMNDRDEEQENPIALACVHQCKVLLCSRRKTTQSCLDPPKSKRRDGQKPSLFGKVYWHGVLAK